MTEQQELFVAPSSRIRAEHQRDSGIKRAGDHADQQEPDWKDRAAQIIADYAAIHGRFLIEEVLPYAALRGLPEPPDARAWGAATKRAKALGYIKACGYAPANMSNRSPKILWRGRYG